MQYTFFKTHSNHISCFLKIFSSWLPMPSSEIWKKTFHHWVWQKEQLNTLSRGQGLLHFISITICEHIYFICLINRRFCQELFATIFFFYVERSYCLFFFFFGQRTKGFSLVMAIIPQQTFIKHLLHNKH